MFFVTQLYDLESIMENSIYLGLSRQMVLQTSMDIVANNIANMSTSGFRAQNQVFEEYLSDPRYNEDPLSFVLDRGQYQNTTAGSIEQTGNPLNVAVNGPGFMGVQLPGGETGYTRDGNFYKSTEGILVSTAGYPIMGQGGPMTIPDDAKEIKIDENGVVSSENGTIGQIQVSEFENVHMLRPVGNNAYTTEDAPIPAENTKLAQGFIEGSNVNAVAETTDMIKILRDFQSTQRVLETEHERMRTAIQKLTQV